MEDLPYERILDVPDEHLTPGMRQYQDAKKLHPNCVVMLRMGDFFELFYEDAILAAKELEITLTARGKGMKRAPLAGVPYHAVDTYIGRLVKKGYKIALVEQLEDPKKAKGLVKRGVVRVITPGTLIESSLLNEKEHNYIAAIGSYEKGFVLAIAEISTGEFFVVRTPTQQGLLTELIRYGPKECVIPHSLGVHQELLKRLDSLAIFVHKQVDTTFSFAQTRKVLLDHFSVQHEDAFGLEQDHVRVAGALLQYLLDTQKTTLSHLQAVAVRSDNAFMQLDASTLQNLELLKNLRDGSLRGTLLSLLDHTVTSLGSRLLRQWIRQPLLDKKNILLRQEAVATLTQKVILREELRELLSFVYDIERLLARVHYKSASPRDLVALRSSLVQLPLIKEKLSSFSGLLAEVATMDDLLDLQHTLTCALRDEVPQTTREGGMIQSGYHEELDRLHDLQKNSKTYLQQLEEKIKSDTGIANVKIGYNRVFGYFIEVGKKYAKQVPSTFVRKQTTANHERYITPELKEEEEKILGAQERIYALEYDLFHQLLTQVAEHTRSLQDIAKHIASLDVLLSFAKIAQEQAYVQPTFVAESLVHIQAGRHPVIEKIEEQFVANDVRLDAQEMKLITGPNMAGKSTLMRQTALIVLLAQMGSFVPAKACTLGIVDRIFTRVGAHDNLSSGQSTFMVEMQETAAILHSATSRSLIILDEIGRGTSTFDGVAIAWSVAEYILTHIQAKTLFATHYHVLNKLAQSMPQVTLCHMAVKEEAGDIVFLRKLLAGGIDQSYGVHVAQLAGLPTPVVARAQQIQQMLRQDDTMQRKLKVKKIDEQLDLGRF